MKRCTPMRCIFQMCFLIFCISLVLMFYCRNIHSCVNSPTHAKNNQKLFALVLWYHYLKCFRWKLHILTKSMFCVIYQCYVQ
jgi:hypothetical protein